MSDVKIASCKINHIPSGTGVPVGTMILLVAGVSVGVGFWVPLLLDFSGWGPPALADVVCSICIATTTTKKH